MRVDGKHTRTIWLEPNSDVTVIDQQQLPHEFVTTTLVTCEEMCVVIKDMHVRGAGLVGASAGAGMHLAARAVPASATPREFDAAMEAAGRRLTATRPTAANLEWAVSRQLSAVRAADTVAAKREAAKEIAQAIMDEDANWCRRIGDHGVRLIEEIAARKRPGEPVNILTHCNAGFLAFVDYGSATAPIYAAFDRGVPVHVWVDETRPKNQGARLTAWELEKHGVPHTVIPDNGAGHLMQHGMVDMVIVGADRVTRTGDVCNKIGTYLKALAAKDNRVPMVVALPSSTIDWKMRDGVAEIPIERRGEREVKYVRGLLAEGGARPRQVEVLVCPEASPAANFAFDVTPARLVDYVITERGVCSASEKGILGLFPERRSKL